MSILIKGMEIPQGCFSTDGICFAYDGVECHCRLVPDKIIHFSTRVKNERPTWCPLIELPPHGDLIDRDALMKDGWLSLWKRVNYMGGYAVHDLPLINPSISVIIESEE